MEPPNTQHSPDDLNAGECGASADVMLLPGRFSGDLGGGGPVLDLATAAGLVVFDATRRATTGAGAGRAGPEWVLCSPVAASIASCLRTPGFVPGLWRGRVTA